MRLPGENVISWLDRTGDDDWSFLRIGEDAINEMIAERIRLDRAQLTLNLGDRGIRDVNGRPVSTLRFMAYDD